MIDIFDDPLLARLYEQENGAYDADLAFYLRFLRPRRGPVLELGAGTGRVVAALAERGFTVTGVERSRAMLAIAEERIAALPSTVRRRVTLLRGDLRRRLPGAHQAAIAAFNSFMHLTTAADQLTVLRRAAAALRPRGHLLMELASPYGEILNPFAGQPRHVYTLPWAGGGSTTLWDVRRVDLANQLTVTLLLYDLIDAGGRITRRAGTVTQRWIFRPELELMLEAAGFRLREIYEDYDCARSHSDPSAMMLVVAEKR